MAGCSRGSRAAWRLPFPACHWHRCHPGLEAPPALAFPPAQTAPRPGRAAPPVPAGGSWQGPGRAAGGMQGLGRPSGRSGWAARGIRRGLWSALRLGRGLLALPGRERLDCCPQQRVLLYSKSFRPGKTDDLGEETFQGGKSWDNASKLSLLLLGQTILASFSDTFISLPC